MMTMMMKAKKMTMVMTAKKVRTEKERMCIGGKILLYGIFECVNY